ncbi:hypothetical protein RRG08_058606 [Elysia crispata]|uniref:BTB domain-containing protein n=1 Tax=Elysia crispata TaxID=231223 RepID=A0AAE1DMC1_9GAST|nr:hypothetical protein RRG08_058606 [Elysia crispata]
MACSSRVEDCHTAKGVLQRLAVFRGDPTFSDIVVTVDDSNFYCHRVVLSAASEFFNKTFTSAMKEAREEKVTLQNVDKSTFSTLLDFAYSGTYVLTEENLFDIWTVADMLQMPLLLSQCKQMCDKLFNTSLSTTKWMSYLAKVRDLNKKAKLRVLRVVTNNFSMFTKHLDFELDELKLILVNDSLDVDSEDDVVEIVLKWADRKLNENGAILEKSDTSKESDQAEEKSSPSQYVVELLESTRYLLISPMCLHGSLACHPLVKADPKCQALVDKICLYQSQPHLHQTWCPTAAVHRHPSLMVNVLILCETTTNGKIMALNLQQMEWVELSRPDILPKQITSKLLWYDSKLYIFTDDGNTRMYMIPTNKYHAVQSACPGITLAVGDSLYSCKESQTQSNQIELYKLSHFKEAFETESVKWKVLNVLPIPTKGMRITDITNIGKTIILFQRSNSTESYSIHSHDTTAGLYKKYAGQIGNRSRLVTFRHDKTVFALQENGRLWKIHLGDQPPDITIKHVAILWTGNIPLNGAIIYRNTLIIVGEFPNQTKVCEKLNVSHADVFQGVQTVRYLNEVETSCPTVSLALIPKKLLG